MDNNGLKKCPFCGEEAAVFGSYYGEDGSLRIHARCDNCGGRTADAVVPDEEECDHEPLEGIEITKKFVRKLWNTRT